jgi:hypothetical protein
MTDLVGQPAVVVVPDVFVLDDHIGHSAAAETSLPAEVRETRMSAPPDRKPIPCGRLAQQDVRQSPDIVALALGALRKPGHIVGDWMFWSFRNLGDASRQSGMGRHKTNLEDAFFS